MCCAAYYTTREVSGSVRSSKKVHAHCAWQARYFGCLGLIFWGAVLWRLHRQTQKQRKLRVSCLAMHAILREFLPPAHATLSSLFACRLALVVALCSFWCRSCNAVRQITLVVARRSFWYLFAQPSCHFAHVRPFLLWHGAHFDIARATFRHFVHVGSLSLRRGAYSDIARATLPSLCAWWMAPPLSRGTQSITGFSNP